MKPVLILLSALLLAACGATQYAAYLIDGGNHSLTVMRQQFVIGGEWDNELVVARMPECQRRYPLPGLGGDKIRIDLYQAERGVFIMNYGKRWYVTETKTCRFEQFKEAPPEPGELIGSFQVIDGKFAFKRRDGKTQN